MFFSFDGIDGAGKSTQLELFAEYLRTLGRQVVTCRDPGSTELGEKIREILLMDFETPISRTSEMLLYMAARAQLVCDVIQPALDHGAVVVSDRYLLSNVVYQGHAGGMGADPVWQVGKVATGGLEPDLSIVLDMPVEDAAGRMGRELDRMESQGDDFRARLRTGFLKEAQRNPERIAVIDARGSVQQVQARVQEAAKTMLS